MVLSSPGVRATAAPFAVWVLLYVSGCADLEVPAEPMPVTPVPESMSTFGKVGYGYFKSNGKKVKLVSFTVDGTEHYSPTYLESGSHTILTRLQWSNHGWTTRSWPCRWRRATDMRSCPLNLHLNSIQRMRNCN